MTQKKDFPRRTNEEWLIELRGNQNPQQQRLAHEDLSRYLYTVAYNHLRTHQAGFSALANFSDIELAELARDFVQDTLEKISRNDFALLNQFSEKGRFTSWTARIIQNQVKQELRKSYWQRRVVISAADEETSKFEEKISSLNLMTTASKLSPHQAAVLTQFLEQLEICLGQLPERARLAFYGCVIREFSTEEMADYLETTPNAVYLLVHRARRKIRTCLETSGFGGDVLQIFE